MLLDDLLKELEPLKGQGYCICFDCVGKGLDKFKDIESIEVDEQAGVIHLQAEELKLKKEDIEFLKELQHEMNTQDHVCQADPRFWIIQGTVKEYGIDSEYADGSELCYADGDVAAENMKEACKFLNEKNEEVSDTNDISKFKYDESSDSISFIDDDGEGRSLCDFEDVLNYLDNPDYYIAYFRNVDKNYEDTLFLTNAACKSHIKTNYYHYPADAHSYAMTAWRSPLRYYKIPIGMNFYKIR